MARAQSNDADLRRDMKQQSEKQRLAGIDKELRTAVQAAEQIPLRSKVQFMFYPEARDLAILKAIAEADGTSVQQLIRDAVSTAVTRRLKPPRVRKKRTTAKGA